MLIYTIVMRAGEDNDVQSWAAANIDMDLFTIRSIEDSAFTPQKILRIETDRLSLDDYCRAAFEGSLNYEVRDNLSDIVWWNRSETKEGRGRVTQGGDA